MENVERQQVVTQSMDETHEWARKLVSRLSAGCVIALFGDLGAGKTCFVQGLAAGLNVCEVVNSPTFTLINEYAGDLPLYHMDFYRIADEDEALDMGLDEYMYGKGITAIEWSERVAAILPRDALRIHIANGDADNQRIITIEEVV